MKRLNILVNCEESQAVTIALRALGHNAFSCDLLECSGGHPEWHLQMDAIKALTFKKWDMLIAFPPCTYLTVSANKWYKDQPPRKSGALVGAARRQARKEAIQFFMAMVNADIPMIAVENPIGIMSTKYRKPDQIIQPWQFGHGETKATCLWLKGLPQLTPTNVVEGREENIWKMSPTKDPNERTKMRSKTYSGIAEAIANQFSAYAEKQYIM